MSYLCFKFINYLPNLEELDASYLLLTNLDGIDYNRCKKLSELNLSHNSLTDDKLSVFQHFPSLIVRQAFKMKLINNWHEF